jgi:trk system potassium uptake protein TrkH
MLKTIKNIIDFLKDVNPIRLAMLGYTSYILGGWILLCLPFVWKVAHVPALDNLFIATSAVSTTGLVTVSISDSYNFTGQLIILLLIQAGGIGYMTFSSFVILSSKRNLSETREGVGQVVFSLPINFRVDKFIRSVIVFTVVIESTGAVLLYAAFRNEGLNNPLWTSIFHSISAFCTAGFSLYNSSFEGFSGSFWINIIIAGLSYCGAVGFIVFVDLWRRITNKEEHVTLTTKIILHVTFWLTLSGTALLFVSEPSIASMPADERLLAAFFQTMTAMTTVGFNSIKISQMSRAGLLLLSTLMIIGASPSGTGGGLKTTTFSALFGVIKSAIRGETHVYFWGRKIPTKRVRLAVATFCFYITFLLIGTYLLELLQDFDLEAGFFEAASALGTVGLSMGITSSLNDLSKVIIIFLMFAGRLGPLTFGMALFLRNSLDNNEDKSDVAV